MKNVKVELISHTENPIETLYHIWQVSRGVGLEGVLPSDFKRLAQTDPTFREKMEKLFLDILNSAIPVSENINFTFTLHNISIALREQLVRHRIGVKHGESMGIDLIPELSSSTFWAQSMRILDMGNFVIDGGYEIPKSILQKGEQAIEAYQTFMASSAQVYKYLVDIGIPQEDARMVIPLAATHTITWTLNLSSLQHILKKRGCWILQLGLWEPIIRGIVEELSTKVSPLFHALIQPPCVKAGKYTGCCFILDNERRVDGRDPLPPCVIYEKKERTALGLFDKVPGNDKRLLQLYMQMQKDYEALWGFKVEDLK